MPFQVEVHSINGQVYPPSGNFPTTDAAKAYAHETGDGISSYWQVFILDGNGNRVMRGVKSGPRATGKRWVWADC